MSTDSKPAARLLQEFKESLAADLKEALADADCERFIRARKGNTEKAAEMATAWWEWFNKPILVSGRKDTSPRNILNPVEDYNEEIYKRLMPHSNFGRGKDGHPIYWEQTGLISTRMGEINTLLTVEDMVVRHIRQQELAVARMRNFSSSLNKPVESQIIVMNLMNLSFKLDTKALSTFKQTLVIDQNYYPERLHILFMINAPWFFTAMWSMIKPWIDPVTVEKFQILGSNYLPTLLEYIDDEYIPSEFGGSYRNFPWQYPANNADFLADLPPTEGAPIVSADPVVPRLVKPRQYPSLRTPKPTINDMNLPLLYFRMDKVEDLGSHHGYRMLIRYKDLKSWKVIRRYSEFKDFRDTLKMVSAVDGYVQWPTLPPKSLFRKSKAVLSERFLGLELFVSAVITKISRACTDLQGEMNITVAQDFDVDNLPGLRIQKSPLRPESVKKLKYLLLEFLDAHSNMSSVLASNDLSYAAIDANVSSRPGRNLIEVDYRGDIVLSQAADKAFRTFWKALPSLYVTIGFFIAVYFGYNIYISLFSRESLGVRILDS